MQPGWHIYWRNPGAAGLPTSVKWHLLAGMTADGIQWPTPLKIRDPGVALYGYENEVLLTHRAAWHSRYGCSSAGWLARAPEWRRQPDRVPGNLCARQGDTCSHPSGFAPSTSGRALRGIV